MQMNSLFFPSITMWASFSVLSPKAPIDTMTFASYVFPPVVGYFVVAALAVMPRTYVLRIALWPVIVLLALRAAVSVDMSLGEPLGKFRNTIFTFSMLFIVTRTLDWTLAKQPLVRHEPAGKSGSRSTIMDALDLALALRGYGWDWARRVYIPRETRPTDRSGFARHAFLSAVAHALMCGALHIAIRSFAPTGHGAVSGGSIFDDTLPFHIQYVRASILSASVLFGIYAFIQTCYDVCTVSAVLVLGHNPAQWPPAFDAPWRPTSLADFWGRRWHQFFRRMFLVQGGYPFAFFLGRVGLVIGAFLSSGVLHHIAMIMLNEQLEPWRITVGFGLMAPGVLAEAAFQRWTGRKVCGVAGWVWTTTWLLLWGNLIVDGFARAGVFGGYLKFTESVVPRVGRVGVERLITSFDAWLHTM